MSNLTDKEKTELQSIECFEEESDLTKALTVMVYVYGIIAVIFTKVVYG